jgi:hypothetical protein
MKEKGYTSTSSSLGVSPKGISNGYLLQFFDRAGNPVKVSEKEIADLLNKKHEDFLSCHSFSFLLNQPSIKD